MKINKKIIFSWVIIFSLFLTTVVSLATIKDVRAGSLWDMQTDSMRDIGTKFGQSGTNPPDVRTIAANIVKIFLELLGIIFLILIIAAGYKWMTAGGNEDKVTSAKSQLKAGVIGMIIIIAAYVIVGFVFNRLAAQIGSSG